LLSYGPSHTQRFVTRSATPKPKQPPSPHQAGHRIPTRRAVDPIQVRRVEAGEVDEADGAGCDLRRGAYSYSPQFAGATGLYRVTNGSAPAPVVPLASPSNALAVDPATATLHFASPFFSYDVFAAPATGGAVGVEGEVGDADAGDGVEGAGWDCVRRAIVNAKIGGS
jgi:hypothetical protein